tara:strand:- start:479 stop:655 length:177 start_codon:yes stop_codon:yes gene_type:complete
MRLSPLEKNVLEVALDHMHEHLTDVYIDFDGCDKVQAERTFEQLHALQTLTFKLLKEL